MVTSCGAGNVTGRPSAFHVAAATAAKTASVERARGGRGIVDDRHGDRRRLGRAQHAERADREVVDLAGRGVDREPFARDPAQRHVRGADRVGTQHDLVERIAGRELDRDARDLARRRPSTCALARAPLGVTTSTSRPSAPATRTACSASPTARRSRLTGGPGTSTSVQRARTSTPSAVGQTRGTPAPRATTPSISTTPSRSTATAAIGGRFGPRRTTSSRA